MTSWVLCLSRHSQDLSSLLGYKSDHSGYIQSGILLSSVAVAETSSVLGSRVTETYGETLAG